MKALCAILLLLSLLPARSAESEMKPSDETVKKDVITVIEAQLAAFRTNDYRKAYGFAAEGIKKMFSLEAFEEMVRNGYPSIATSKSARFGLILDDGKQAVVHVFIEGDAKSLKEFAYVLVLEDSKWKINGVVEVKARGEKA